MQSLSVVHRIRTESELGPKVTRAKVMLSLIHDDIIIEETWKHLSAISLMSKGNQSMSN